MGSTKNNAQKVWAAVVRHAKEHHESVNGAVNAYYPHTISQPAVSYNKSASSASSLAESPASTPSSSRRSSVEKIWDGVKRHAKEHHESVNSAVSVYYHAPRA
ncbi:hypothetical protein HJFPF1_08715 [Paramyrothecium foliicola]|nr:hypothetical protein HJFPF1_08715 [Paramyrothecium foliicola]